MRRTLRRLLPVIPAVQQSRGQVQPAEQQQQHEAGPEAPGPAAARKVVAVRLVLVHGELSVAAAERERADGQPAAVGGAARVPRPARAAPVDVLVPARRGGEVWNVSRRREGHCLEVSDGFGGR